MTAMVMARTVLVLLSNNSSGSISYHVVVGVVLKTSVVMGVRLYFRGCGMVMPVTVMWYITRGSGGWVGSLESGHTYQALKCGLHFNVFVSDLLPFMGSGLYLPAISHRSRIASKIFPFGFYRSCMQCDQFSSNWHLWWIVCTSYSVINDIWFYQFSEICVDSISFIYLSVRSHFLQFVRAVDGFVCTLHAMCHLSAEMRRTLFVIAKNSCRNAFCDHSCHLENLNSGERS